MQLTEHFSLEELTHSDIAEKNNIPNTPDALQTSHLKELAIALEQVRTILGNNPINIDVGFRSPELNKIVGGVSNSDHMLGYAADIKCALSPHDICSLISNSDLKFDQVINEFDTWTHISINPRLRMQFLRASKLHGKTVYQQGY